LVIDYGQGPEVAIPHLHRCGCQIGIDAAGLNIPGHHF
jgi:hypothetical protein